MHTPSISRQVSGKRRVFALLLGLFLLISSTCAYSEGVSVSSRIDALLSAQQSAAGADSLQSWLNGALCKQAGSSAEWYVLALRQNTQGLDYSAYADVLQQYVEITPPASASSRLKLALLLTACGRADHPFVAAARAEDIGRQGVMSWIYGLHLLNNLPDTAGEIDQAVASLLSLQLADGGWAVMGAQSDADVTAMALQALAPTLANHSDAQAAADRALALLSVMQADTGDYRSMGTSNCESAAQVIIALCALGIDPLTDARFIKNGYSALDAMLRYQLEDNAFAHTASGAKNNMATVQALSALIALKRFQAGQGSYYLLDALPAAQQAAAVGWKTWAIIEIAAFGILFTIILWLLKKRNYKNFILLWLICGALALALCLLRIESAANYYSPSPTAEASMGEVTLTIRCDTVKGLTDARYIPDSAVILPEASYKIAENATVYDVLVQAAKKNQLQLDCRGTYVAGISHLYEFDFGNLSGWMYRVNGVFPDVGCGEYQLSDGDRIEWLYTCDLGRDLP